MNKALVAKTMWKWLKTPRSWWMGIVPAQGDATKQWMLETATPFWRSMKTIQPFFSVSVSFQLGNGNNISFWEDKWLQEPIMHKYPNLYSFAVNKMATVHMSQNQGQWNINVRQELSQRAATEFADLMQELANVTVQPNQNDIPKWRWQKDEDYTVKTFYGAMVEGPQIETHIKTIWKMKAPTRVTVFVWLMLRNRILTIDNLKRKGWVIPSICYMCRNNE